jgi:hypothetical protein
VVWRAVSLGVPKKEAKNKKGGEKKIIIGKKK